MGYLTSFSLTAELPEGDLSNEMMDALKREIGERFCFLAGNAKCGWDAYDTWYGWKDDMTEFSRKFPNILFELHGNGDEFGDTWKAFFQNGKSQVHEAHIEYDDFDPSWGETTSDRDNRLTKQLIAASRVNPNERYCDDTTIYRNDMGGYSSCIFQKGITSVQTIPADMFSWNHDDNLEEYLSLREIWEQAQKFLGRRHPVLYVWVDSPLRGEIYQCGNCPENPHWILHGVTEGYA